MTHNPNSPWRTGNTKLTSYSEEERENKIIEFEKKGYKLLGIYEENANFYTEKIRYQDYKRKTIFDTPKKFIAIMKRGD